MFAHSNLDLTKVQYRLQSVDVIKTATRPNYKAKIFKSFCDYISSVVGKGKFGIENDSQVFK